jgi:hypothetical protein
MPASRESMNRRFALFAAVTIFAMSVVGRRLPAQTASERAVRAVVDSFFAAVDREQWDSAAALIDLTRFEPYFKAQIRNARSAMPMQFTTVEELMATDSTMPRAVAEWEVAQMTKARAEHPYLGVTSEFFGVTTQHELFALTLPDATARWIEAQDDRAQIRDAWKRAGCTDASLTVVMPFLAPKHVIVATVVADDTTAYAIQSDEPVSGDPANLFNAERVIELHRVGGRWRIAPQRDLLHAQYTSFRRFGGCPKKE